MQVLRSVVIGAVAAGSLIFGWYGFQMYRNRKLSDAMLAENQFQMSLVQGENDRALQSDEQGSGTDTSDSATLNEDIPEDFLAHDVIQWNGGTYRRNTYTKAILCMGVDRGSQLTESRGYNEAGQADSIFLLAQDTARNTLKILMIPRDSMAEIGIIREDMSSAGTQMRQLALAYANGDGRESSCENTVSAAESLLHGFEIDSYLAADMEIINLLNEAVGGVTVTIPTAGMEKKDAAFVKGATIKLQGEQAESFVRYRDIESAYSAVYRMDQQQEFITGFYQAVQDMSKQNSQIVPQLFELIEDYMVTDMSKDQYMKIAVDALNQGKLGQKDFLTLPGSSIQTELYEEYYTDEKGTVQVILNLFYRESSV